MDTNNKNDTETAQRSTETIFLGIMKKDGQKENKIALVLNTH